jgi:hypothetical protein
MSSSDYAQVTTIVQRLGDFLSLLNPARVVGLVAEIVHEVRTPPPGDPDGLAELARAFRTAADAVAPIGGDVRTIGTDRLPQAWSGGAATDAAAVITATAKAVDRTPTALRDAATVLDDLATQVRAQQRRHGDLHQALHDAKHDATHAFGLPIPDPTALDDLVRAVAGLISGCIDVYTDSLDSADRAASRFADLTGQARAAAAVDGGLAPDDAVVLAGQTVTIPGAGDAYDDGILSPAQLERAGTELAGLSPEDRRRFDDLLARAGSDTERAWLLKGLAAGHGMPELTRFADTIRGRDEAWLNSHLSLIDRGGVSDQIRSGTDVRQYEDTTCGTTSLIVARAEADPLYALSLTEGNFEENFERERDRVHDETNVIWPEALGTSPEGMADSMNRQSGATGTTYDWHLVDDTNHREISATMREVVTAADRGHPVPMLVGGAVPRHYVLVVGHSGGDVLVYEPTSGETVRVPERDFMSGNLSGSAGFDHVQAVVVPNA